MSDGAIKQEFPPELVVPLTEAEKEAYRDALGEESWRVVSEQGFILVDVSPPYCAIITEDGLPREARHRCLSMLKARGGRIIMTEDNEADPHNISAELDLDEKHFVSVVFSIRFDTDARGFYASASKWARRVN